MLEALIDEGKREGTQTENMERILRGYLNYKVILSQAIYPHDGTEGGKDKSVSI